jgi:hypothetical protein
MLRQLEGDRAADAARAARYHACFACQLTPLRRERRLWCRLDSH